MHLNKSSSFDIHTLPVLTQAVNKTSRQRLYPWLFSGWPLLAQPAAAYKACVKGTDQTETYMETNTGWS